MILLASVELLQVEVVGELDLQGETLEGQEGQEEGDAMEGQLKEKGAAGGLDGEDCVVGRGQGNCLQGRDGERIKAKRGIWREEDQMGGYRGLGEGGYR